MLVIVKLTYVELTFDCSSSFSRMKIRLLYLVWVWSVVSYTYDSHVLSLLSPLLYLQFKKRLCILTYVSLFSILKVQLLLTKHDIFLSISLV